MQSVTPALPHTLATRRFRACMVAVWQEVSVASGRRPDSVAQRLLHKQQ